MFLLILFFTFPGNSGVHMLFLSSFFAFVNHFAFSIFLLFSFVFISVEAITSVSPEMEIAIALGCLGTFLDQTFFKGGSGCKGGRGGCFKRNNVSKGVDLISRLNRSLQELHKRPNYLKPCLLFFCALFK